MGRHVVLSPRAEAQLGSIYRYIAAQSGTARADLVISRLIQACAALDLFPERGASRNDLFPNLRVMGYRRQATIAFTVEPKTVTIQGVLRRGRNMETLFRE